MAQHLTNAQIQTVLAKTGSNMKPYEIFALAASLDKAKHVEGTDKDAGASESTLGTIFPSGAQQW